jgi:uncharacterized protein DUF1707/cell wall-active antibiotic response 4TMS protein YvqF
MTAEDHPDLRASDHERDRTIDILREAAGEGRLTFEELADRIEDAAAARTRGELERLTRDLPITSAAADPAPAEVATPAAHSSVLGDVHRAGAWVVPARSSWRSCFGDIVLDLREARVGAGEVVIDANTIFGDIDVLVPEHIAVEVRIRTILGFHFHTAGDAAAPAGAPRVILTGRTVFGDVHVRARRLRERIADRLLGRPQRG